jgi:GT2 family glycosyltransferase
MASRISILIITYNRPADLLELLIDVNAQAYYNEVVEEMLILNNASTDDYTDVTDYINNNPQLKAKYIWSDENLGVAKGRNKLIGIAKGDLYLSIDDDMVFTKANDLQRLSLLFDEPFFKEANTGVITFRVIYYENREVQVTAFPHKKYDKYCNNPRFLTAYFAGGAHIMKREVLDKTGIYPTDFHYGMEEYDLAYRIVNAGYSMGYDNGVTVAHKESPLGRQPNYKKLQMQWINKSKVAWRYLPFKYFVTTAASWAIQYLRMARGHFGAFFSAIFQVLAIPFREKRMVINKKALEYLHKVEARLKY